MIWTLLNNFLYFFQVVDAKNNLRGGQVIIGVLRCCGTVCTLYRNLFVVHMISPSFQAPDLDAAGGNSERKCTHTPTVCRLLWKQLERIIWTVEGPQIFVKKLCMLYIRATVELSYTTVRDLAFSSENTDLPLFKNLASQTISVHIYSENITYQGNWPKSVITYFLSQLTMPWR